MCLSSPTTAAAPSAGDTTNRSNNNVDDTTAATTVTSACGKVCSNSSSGSCTNNNNNSIKQRKSHSNQQHNDLNDNLGYKEENAVYKEFASKSTNASSTDANTDTDEMEMEYNPKIRWPDLGAQSFLHAGALYGLYLLFSAKLYTLMWVVVTIWASGVGITAGAHRLWSHKSYTASLPLRILLIMVFTIAGQRDAYTWALDHRIHHKFSETDADPHNAKRGFFFAHVGWLFLTPHPKVEAKRKVIDMSDLDQDAVVAFQRKWYIPMFAVLSIGVPVLVPWYFWGESLWLSFWVNFNLRFCCTLNVAFFVNSVAHMWGGKPYDKSISSVENPIVSFLALGEGWHNYHHVFPWDYKTGEFGNYSLNITTGFIDLCAKLGLAKNRKSVSKDMVLRRAAKCGDGTRFLSDEHAHKDQVWGYGDKDIPKDDLAELSKMTD